MCPSIAMYHYVPTLCYSKKQLFFLFRVHTVPWDFHETSKVFMGGLEQAAQTLPGPIMVQSLKHGTIWKEKKPCILTISLFSILTDEGLGPKRGVSKKTKCEMVSVLDFFQTVMGDPWDLYYAPADWNMVHNLWLLQYCIMLWLYIQCAVTCTESQTHGNDVFGGINGQA